VWLVLYLLKLQDRLPALTIQHQEIILSDEELSNFLNKYKDETNIETVELNICGCKITLSRDELDMVVQKYDQLMNP